MTATTRFGRVGLAFGLVTLVALLGVQSLGAQDTKAADRERLLKGRACDRCDLSGVNFLREDLKGVSASEANLTQAMFYRADLSGANLGGANLEKANLSFANLTNTNLSNANLAGANLGSSTGASIAGAITTETTTCPDGHAGPCR